MSGLSSGCGLEPGTAACRVPAQLGRPDRFQKPRARCGCELRTLETSLRLPAVYRNRPGLSGLGRSPARTTDTRTRTETDSADTDALHAHAPRAAGFLNRMRRLFTDWLAARGELRAGLRCAGSQIRCRHQSDTRHVLTSASGGADGAFMDRVRGRLIGPELDGRRTGDVLGAPLVPLREGCDLLVDALGATTTERGSCGRSRPPV
jgi:hypothetical protein